MELDKEETKASVRSIIRFSKSEIIEIIFKHLVDAGYSFSKEATYSVRFPRHHTGEENICLVANMCGETEPINEPFKE